MTYDRPQRQREGVDAMTNHAEAPWRGAPLPVTEVVAAVKHENLS